jgi:predicted dehydrogenase
MWGKRLGAAARKTEGLRLVTCYSRDVERVAAAAQELGCEAAGTLEAALDHPDVEAVLLVTPNYHHKEGALACARRGKHLFVEKPIAETIEEGRVMQQVFQMASLTLFVGHCFRRLGAARKVKELVDAGALGSVVLAEANFSLPGDLAPDKWRSYRRTCPGGPLLQLGIHHADTLQYWLGPVLRVHGSFAHLVTPAEIDDVGLAVLEFTSGARGVITSSYVSPKTFSLRLYGSQGVLEYQTELSIWPDAGRMDEATTLTLRTRTGSEQVDFERRNMLVDELAEFAHCVRGEAEPETGAQEGLAALAVIQGALRSHRLHKSMRIFDDRGLDL